MDDIEKYAWWKNIAWMSLIIFLMLIVGFILFMYWLISIAFGG